MTDKKEKNLKSNTIADLLFNGMTYRFVSEPDKFRQTPEDIHAFLDFKGPKNIEKRISKIESTKKIIDQIKDRNGAFSAFEAFLEQNPYGLILLDDDLNLIYHNQKASSVIDQLFNSDNPKKLHARLKNQIKQAQQAAQKTPSKLITLSSAIEKNTNAYLISNKQNNSNDHGSSTLLIPFSEGHNFELHDELVSQYNLTSKEQALLSKLISGLELKQISEQSCVSLNTVKSHLKSLFRKTDTKSQAGLIRLFLNHESHIIDSYFNVDIPSPIMLDESSDLFVTLSSGSKLCYRCYGPENGRPLVIFHNLFGSRYHIPYDASETLIKSNRRIIIPERPGYGKSDYIPHRNQQWSEIFNEFIAYLGLTKFDLLGNVSSCVHVLEYADQYPQMINKIIFTSPAFYNLANQRPLLGPMPYAAARLCAFSKKVAYEVFRLWMKSLQYDPQGYIRSMVQQYSGSAEKQATVNEQFINRLTLNHIESQRNKSKGSAQDAVFSVLPRNLDLSKIVTPIDIWIGDEDACIPVASAQQICAPLPNKTFHIRKGYGEDIFYHLFSEIIQ